ncbi:hypothetical protein KP509_35G024700 [Ceratopteris richardii]|uniref:Casparian strip membrane protein domain-containing protein n=1 Tax=Ceratopteris richardii TaxID=49495 RepID=A0A8T2QFW3_CERRI|nr:hypothetical protein KP509_35G024700 [Ceratopteris richardii]
MSHTENRLGQTCEDGDDAARRSNEMQDADVEPGNAFRRAQIDAEAIGSAAAGSHQGAIAEMEGSLRSVPSSSASSSLSEMRLESPTGSTPCHFSRNGAPLVSADVISEHQYRLESSPSASSESVKSPDYYTSKMQSSENIMCDSSKDCVDGGYCHENLGGLSCFPYLESWGGHLNGSSMPGISKKDALENCDVSGQSPARGSFERSEHERHPAAPTASISNVPLRSPPLLPVNSAIKSHGQTGLSTQSSALDVEAAGDRSVEGKGAAAKFKCTDNFENGGIKGTSSADRILHKIIGRCWRKHSSPCNRQTGGDLVSNQAKITTRYKTSMFAEESSVYGGDESKVNAVPSGTDSEASDYKAMNDLMFSRSFYYKPRSDRIKNLTAFLRFGGALFSLIAFSVTVSTNEERIAGESTFYVKFSDYQAYNYVAAINLLTFLYSSGQLVLLARARTTRILSSPLKWSASVYACDQILAFLMVSSSSSAATASQLSRFGLRNIWPPACSTWRLSFFCLRADISVAMSFVSCFFMFLSTLSSGWAEEWNTK